MQLSGVVTGGAAGGNHRGPQIQANSMLIPFKIF